MRTTPTKQTIYRIPFAALCAVALLFSAASSAQAARFSEAADDIERVVETLDSRLALMPEVAAWKWRARQPIVDLERERAVLDASVADAQAIGLDGEAARKFFDVQIRMARAAQEAAFTKWRAENVSPSVGRDLASELRPLLDRIGRELLVAAYLAANDLEQTQVESLVRLKRHGVNDALLNELHASLIALRIVKPAEWQTVERVGVLRVGMTGDYAPFSYERDGVLRGFDVALAQSLAAHWNVKVEFVRTSWPTLMSDFLAHRFDVALSGISVTPERAARADFSTAYHTDGKTPIARCNDAPKFSSLEQIDRPEVRVVMNPGGTNERFVRERIKRASVRVHPDNRTVFDEILARRADVMITDGVEVRLMTLRHPELCGTMKSAFTQAPKAVMLPRGSDLTRRVNDWLEPQAIGGALQTQLEQALNEAR